MYFLIKNSQELYLCVYIFTYNPDFCNSKVSKLVFIMTLVRALSLSLVLSVMAIVGQARERRYFIAARDLEWDYAPGVGIYSKTGQSNIIENFIQPKENRIGSKYKKTGYFQYTGETFTKEIPKPVYLGLLGPVMRGELHDVIVVHFYNNASRNYSIHPHGVFYHKNHEGALYLDNTTDFYKVDDSVPPGGEVVLEWSITVDNAPTDDDPNCIPWLYHSHVNAVRDVATGLIGPLVTCKKGVLNDQGERTDVTNDFPLLSFNWDENLSWFQEDNIQNYCLNPQLCQRLNADGDTDFKDSNVKRSFNALTFGTLPGLEVCREDKVVFYVFGFGNEKDVHSLHFHGQNVKFQHVRGDTVYVYSATFVAAETTSTTDGQWLISDMVGDHEKEGAYARYVVNNCKYAPRPTAAQPLTRSYYLAVEEVKWSYTAGESPASGRQTVDDAYNQSPAGLNANTRNKGSFDYRRYNTKYLSWYRAHSWRWPKWSINSPGSNGTTYTKAKFVRYTDASFGKRVSEQPRDAHLGIVGPVLGAELGDRLVVVLRNYVPFNVSFLAHGMSYDVKEEAAEGDITPGGAVGQGHAHTYTFYVPTNLLDGASEPCKVFLYTSGVDPRRAQNTGLVGPLLICRKNQLTIYRLPTKQFFLLFSIVDETKSFYSNQTNETVADMKFAINGYTRGTLPGLDLCYDETVQWHVMSVGTELDVHTVTFDGNGFTEDGQNRDGRHLVPGETGTLTMRPDTLGKWMVYSQSYLARQNGMFAFYDVNECLKRFSENVSGPKGAKREYFIAAEEVFWDYAPLQRTIVNAEDLNDPNTEGSIFVRHDANLIGHIYKKVVFTEYQDGTFTAVKPGSDRDILGPVMRAEVGDTVIVTFKNNASRPYSFYSHGLKKSQRDSGVDYGYSKGVDPGQTRQYILQVPPRAGPGSNDPNCVPWLYYSSVDPVKDTHSGLMGLMVVCRRGTLDTDSRRKDVNAEQCVYMSVMNENLSHYLEENVMTFAPGRVGTDYRNDELFQESNRKHAINGRLYGNNEGLVFEYGQKIVLYAMSFGSEIDLHTLHLHGHTFVHSSQKHRDDVIAMFPGMAEAVEMVTDNPGTWLIHCHVLDHIAAGMETTYTVLPPEWNRKTEQKLVCFSIQSQSNMAQIMIIAALLLNISPMGSYALVRQYFIATRELEWDYAPGGGVFRTLEQQTFADNYIMPRENRIGNIYKKAGYFQYTDDTFKTEIPKPIYLGLLGPLIRAELDDVIQIHFYNNASRNYSIHPHGVFYLKNSESAQYLDNTMGIYKVDDNVPPGGKVVLEWSVTENNAPTDDDPNCLPWLYHAHVNAVQDVASGPIGVLITCKKGTLNNKNERTDVTYDFPLLVFNWDENLNWYIDYNIQTYCLNQQLCQQLNADGDPYFIDSNVKRSINALAFGTLPGLEVCVGDDVNFYVIGFGNEKDVHSLHFHGQNVKFQHVRGDTVFVYSATFVTAETTPTTEGKWLITDMVGDHEKAGTWAYYKVTNCEQSTHQPRLSKTRWYYLAAEEYQWNYARPQSDGPYRRKRSSEFDRYKSEFLSWYRVRAWSWPKLSNASAQFNANYTKAKFVRYTDGTFREEATRLSQDDHLGTLGPVLRAEVGERIKVTLKNSIPFNVSFLPHGVSYTLAEEAELEDSDPDVSVGQGHAHTYTFYVPTNLLDGASEPCKVFLYTSGVDPRRAQNTGLVGPLLICRKNHLTSYK
ncbi:hypothetical protein Btru_068385, partial [Bulinus truncatus]